MSNVRTFPPLDPDQINAQEATRFWLLVAKSSGCWLWTGAKTGRGYGHYWIGTPRQKLYAHRIAYVLSVGAIRAGQVLDHTCRNLGCVNPAHLEQVSPQENTARARGNGAYDARMEVRLERALKDAAQRAADADGVKLSPYVRGLILVDVERRRLRGSEAQ